MEHWILATNIKRKGIITDRWSKIQACEYLLRITLQLWLPSKQSNYIDQYKPSHCCLYALHIMQTKLTILVEIYTKIVCPKGDIYVTWGLGLKPIFLPKKGVNLREK